MNCCIIGCKNNRRPSRNTTYHTFPHPDREPSRYKKWVRLCNNPKVKTRNSYNVFRSFRICRRHFDKEYFNGVCKRLLCDAVPSLHMDENDVTRDSDTDNMDTADDIQLINNASKPVITTTTTYNYLIENDDSNDEGNAHNKSSPSEITSEVYEVVASSFDDELKNINFELINDRERTNINRVHNDYNDFDNVTDSNETYESVKPNKRAKKRLHDPDEDFHNDVELYEVVPVNDDKGTVEITNETVNRMRKLFYDSEKNVVAQNVCSRFNLDEVALSKNVLNNTHHIFTHKIDEIKPVSSQKQSGRCWIFAACNAMRIPFAKSLNIEEFEFSQIYLHFYDKLERSNFFLNNIVSTAFKGESVDGRLLSFMLRDPINDAGQWNMVSNLILKYGMMPKSCFNESFSSENTSRMNTILQSKLREYAKILREEIKMGISPTVIKCMINDQMKEIHTIIGILLGIPNETFVWEYYDKDKKYHSIGPITPIQFYEQYVKPTYDVKNKYCIVNDPREENGYDKMYTIDYLGNSVGGQLAIYNNQPINILMNLVVESIKKGEPMWFGSEVDKHFFGDGGIHDLKVYDYKSLLGVETDAFLTKAERLQYYDSQMTHAMVITGVSLDTNGCATKFRVENSWGDAKCDKGYIVMTADWFKEFVFEIVVDKSLIPEDILKVYDQTPIVLPAWDPMGTLAKIK